MINRKNSKDIQAQIVGGRICGQVRNILVSIAKPGMTTWQLDQIAERLIKAAGGLPSFQIVPGYHHTICTTVNDEVVHGIPGKYQLKKGDLLSLDLGVLYGGWHTDCATTIFLGEPDDKIAKFLEVGQTALNLAISKAKSGNQIRDISAAIQNTVEGAGFSVVRALVGHGVGRQLHEDPQVPGFVTNDLELRLTPGLTLAVEVIYTTGSCDVRYAGYDGWTISTVDGSQAALFEDSIAITKNGPLILTRPS